MWSCTVKKALSGAVICLFLQALFSPKALAVVGRAEEFDPFEMQNVMDFQKKMTMEETDSQFGSARDVMNRISELENQQKQATGKEQVEAYNLEIEELKRQILNVPKPDRFTFELLSDAQYLSNSNGARPTEEKDDTVFDVGPTFLTDLSGKKTDLRFELNGGKQWNVEFPEKDFWKAEERLRYRRNYFKKITVAANSRIARTSNKTVEIDDNKIRWDSTQNNTLNYAFSKKLSLNMDTTLSKRLFMQEAFDQDSGWEATFAPSAFWNIRPKSRLSLGYSFGVSRNWTKSSDANSQNINLGYFGQVTRKSSASLNVAYSRQNSYKTNEISRTYTVGVGYIWQATAKSQLTAQVIRSLQNTTSDLVSGTAEDGVVTRKDSYFTNDSISVSLNTRLTRKINIGLTQNISWTRTKTTGDEDADARTQQQSFPTTATLTYLIARWITFNLNYSFNVRTGDEKGDNQKAHTTIGTLRMIF